MLTSFTSTISGAREATIMATSTS